MSAISESTRVSAEAVVTMTIQVTKVGTWGAGCTVEQIHRQAMQVAMLRVQELLGNSNGCRIVGEPIVQSVSVEQER